MVEILIGLLIGWSVGVAFNGNLERGKAREARSGQAITDVRK
jgi:hypothetical protein